MNKYQAADKVIADLTKAGYDYTSKREDIANLFEDYLWQGNWDMTTDFGDVADLWLIQEDEYDQSMDEDEKPEWDAQLCFSAGHYVFLA